MVVLADSLIMLHFFLLFFTVISERLFLFCSVSWWGGSLLQGVFVNCRDTQFFFLSIIIYSLVFLASTFTYKRICSLHSHQNGGRWRTCATSWRTHNVPISYQTQITNIPSLIATGEAGARAFAEKCRQVEELDATGPTRQVKAAARVGQLQGTTIFVFIYSFSTGFEQVACCLLGSL